MENNYVICNGELCRVDELKHYGVLGMKWGVRRAQKLRSKAEMHRRFAEDLDPKNYTVKLTSKERSKLESQKRAELSKAETLERKAVKSETKATIKAEAKAAKQAQSAKKSVSEMSDAELRAYINRVQMERQYSQLNKRQQSEGEKFVKGVLNESAKNVATKYVTKYATKAIDNIIERAAKK